MLFFYNKKMLGETLLITIQSKEEVTYEDKKNITLIKDENGALVGLNIFNVENLKLEGEGSIELSDEQKERANKLKESLLKNGVSKYNVGHNDQQFFEKINQLKQQKNCSIHLVIGQVEDDASVQNSLSCVQTNGELLTKVRQIYPNDIVI